MDAHPTKNFPETTTRGETLPRKSRARARLPLSIGQAYGRFLELLPVVVLAVMWMVGLAHLGSIALMLYLNTWAPVRLVAGSI